MEPTRDLAHHVPPWPVDGPLLRVVTELLDPSVVTRHVAVLLDQATDARHVDIRYVHVAPGDRAVVHYRANGPDGAVDVLATVEGGAAGPTIEWTRYPRDPGLPLLVADAPAFGEWLGYAIGGSSVVLSWVPGTRAVLGFDNAVVKLYRDPQDAVTAVRAARLLEGRIPTAAVLAADVGRGVVAFERLTGRTIPGREAESAGMVGQSTALLEVLHGQRIDDAFSALARRDPGHLVTEAAVSTALVSWRRPDLAPRIADVLAELTRRSPAVHREVVSHGDFNVGQLLETEGGIRLLDLDTLCVAAPALDLATYAANVMSGRRGDLARVRAITALLLDGYRTEVEAFNWYLTAVMVRRADRPMRRWKRDRDDRTDRMLSAAEEVLG